MPSAPVPSLAASVAGADPLADAAVPEAAATALSDHVAASFAVAADRAARAARDRLLAWAVAEGNPATPRLVTGTGAHLAPSRAALVAGFQAHLLDLDDTHEEVRGHPSAVLFPALLALASDDTGLPRLLASYTVGLEVMARLGRALGPAHYAAGWHPTGTAGAIAAAAAGAHLLGLDADRTGTALSLAASQSGGMRAQFGTEAKPLHAGLAAQAGVHAVQWATAGIQAAPGAVTGPAGLLAAFGVPDADARFLTAGFGTPWALREPGLWFKRFPFCSAAMSLGDAARQIGAALQGTPAERATRLRHIVIQMRPGADAALIHQRPATGEQGRFSAEYVAALVLLGLEPTLERLSPAPLEPVAAGLLPRIEREHVARPPVDGSDPSIDPGTGRPRRDFWARVEVILADGRRLEAEVERPIGSPQRPLTAADHRRKLVEATGDAVRADAIEALLTAPTGRRVGDLTALIVHPPLSHPVSSDLPGGKSL